MLDRAEVLPERGLPGLSRILLEQPDQHDAIGARIGVVEPGRRSRAGPCQGREPQALRDAAAVDVLRHEAVAQPVTEPGLGPRIKNLQHEPLIGVVE